MTEDEHLIETLARAAGLDLAWARFREDVIAAARQVQGQRLTLGDVIPDDEPWPPMRVDGAP